MQSHIDSVMQAAWLAFEEFRLTLPAERSALMYNIATRLKKEEGTLLQLAMKETHLGKARLKSELDRTCFQWTSYADACAEGSWMEARIDRPDSHRNPPKPDLRKMMQPLGPVVVFGASNFPFAYSTAGGDTACAIAAGCSVVVKAHPAHPETSCFVANLVQACITDAGVPPGVFQHVSDPSVESGQSLVMHPLTKAAAFTGSYEGGTALWKLANSREEPIPFFAEMGSVNPVIILPSMLRKDPEGTAEKLIQSICQSAGQFCTNPGLMITMEGEGFAVFEKTLAKQIEMQAPQEMLHPGIAENFHRKRNRLVDHKSISLIGEAREKGNAVQTNPGIAKITSREFLSDPLFQDEIFGPFSLLIVCHDMADLLQLVSALRGQLTASVFGEDNDQSIQGLLHLLREKAGRLIFNGVPTGVTVAASMQHGGPFPATTDSRFTAVGADGIRRFLRPLCYQNFPDSLLPPALQDRNPLGIWRMLDGEWTRKPL